MMDILAGKDENDIEVRNLKHGWPSLPEQMAQQYRAAAAETAVARQAVFTYYMSAVGVTPTAIADYCILMTPPPPTAHL